MSLSSLVGVMVNQVLRKPVIRLAWLTLLALGFSQSVWAQSPDPISQAILKIASPYQVKLTRTAESLPRLKAELLKFESTAQAIHHDKNLSHDQKVTQLLQLRRKYELTMRQWFQKSAVDELAYRAEVEDLFRTIEVRTKRRYLRKYHGFLSYSWRGIPGKLLPILHDKEIVSVAPYTYEIKEPALVGNVEADRLTGEHYTHILLAAAGSFLNAAGIGQEVAFNGAFQETRVSATTIETYWSAYSLAALAGATGGRVDSRLSVVSASGDRLCQQQIEHTSILAPVLWFAHETGTEDVLLECQATLGGRVDKLIIEKRSSSEVWAIGAASSSFTTDGKLSEIRVQLKR